MGSIPGLKDTLKKKMATHHCNLDQKIPWTEEPGRLQSMGSQEPNKTEQLNNNNNKQRYGYEGTWDEPFGSLVSRGGGFVILPPPPFLLLLFLIFVFPFLSHTHTYIQNLKTLDSKM